MSTTASSRDHLEALVEASKGSHVVVKVQGTDYRLMLEVDPSRGTFEPGERVNGRVTGRARRIDVVGAGGRFVEPVYGRPRRVQGRVRAYDAQTGQLTVWAGFALQVQPTAVNQKPEALVPGQLVAFDLEPGARFEPIDR